MTDIQRAVDERGWGAVIGELADIARKEESANVPPEDVPLYAELALRLRSAATAARAIESSRRHRLAGIDA